MVDHDPYRGDASSHISLLALVREVAADATSPAESDACLRRLRQGLIRLGFRRVGIWVTVSSNPSILQGSWGTAWDGSEIDEHRLTAELATFVGSAGILRGDHVVLSHVEPQGDRVESLKLPLVAMPGLPNRACVALRADGRLLGIISVDMLPTQQTIDPEHVAALEVVVDHVASALARGQAMAALRAELAERQLAEESLRASEESQRGLFNGVPIGLYRTTPAGDIVAINLALVELLGYDNPEQLNALSVSTYVDPEDQTRFRAIIERDGVVHRFESRLRHRDGTVIWVEDSGRVISNPDGSVRYYEGSLQDVTERKRAEAALRESEERLRFLVEHTGDAIYRLRFDTMLYDYISPTIEILTGYTADDILRVGWDAIIQERATLQGARIGEDYLKDLRSPQTTGPFHADYLIRTRSGQIRWLEDRSEPWRDRDGTLLGSVGVLSDITERKLLEERLREAQKMQAIGKLAGGIAHDFNNLLTVINGYADLLRSQSKPNTFSFSAAEQILSAGESAAKLTGHLLAYSRQQISAPRELELNAQIDRISQIVRRTIGEDITFAIVLNSGPSRILADPTQIEQIVMNLVSNARDAMPSGGKLTIQTSPMYLGESYVRAHPEAKIGPHVMLAIGDTGRGMDPETVRRIFEPFYTTKDERQVGKGAGLGLAAVYGMVKQCGGAIDVYSEPGIGTTFKVYFPRIDQASVGIDDPEDQINLPRGTETILVIEDEGSVREFARVVLDASGYTVIEAEDGEQALRLTGARTTPIDLVLSDVVMPGLSGPQIAGRLCELYPTLKVVYMSGFTDDMVFRHGVISAGLNFLQKPFTPAGLTRKVRDILDS